ncbi:MAG TPA: HD domain-containing protein [archaeon]|nr:HD domain-containing protein [archaeon]HRT02466.1 HD domain-containing protein [Candidatus Diapherotrites archaeon]
MDNNTIYKKQIEILKKKIKPFAPDYEYHNYSHLLDVFDIVTKLGKKQKLSEHDVFLLQTAALLHDIVYVKGREDNEEKSVEFTKSFLPGLGYSKKDIDSVCDLISVTNLKMEPKTKLEQIIRDADIDNLRRKDFFEKTECLRKEQGVDKNEWYSSYALDFLRNIKFYTTPDYSSGNSVFKKNLRILSLIKKKGSSK